jgi:hypothetical protein
MEDESPDDRFGLGYDAWMAKDRLMNFCYIISLIEEPAETGRKPVVVRGLWREPW